MITAIDRYLVGYPNIVGIVTTDTIDVITAPGYFATQTAAIQALQNGKFQWQTADTVLCYYAPGVSGFFNYDPINNTLISTASNTRAQVTLTAAQIKGMYAAPVLLIPAPGLNYMNVIDSILWDVAYTAPQFTLGGATQAQYGATAAGAGTAASTSIPGATIDAIAASTLLTQTGIAALNVANSVVNNAGIYLSNATAAFATGNSSAVLNIAYHTIAI